MSRTDPRDTRPRSRNRWRTLVLASVLLLLTSACQAGPWGWGYNNRGQVGDGTSTSHATPVALGQLVEVGKHQLVLDARHPRRRHPLGLGEQQLRPAGQRHGSAHVETAADRHRHGLGQRRGQQQRLHGAALRADGSLYTWGYNSDGQLGFGAVLSCHVAHVRW